MDSIQNRKVRGSRPRYGAAHRRLPTVAHAATPVLLVSPVVRALVVMYGVATPSPRRRYCDHCGHPVTVQWLVTAAMPRGRCRACSAGVGAPAFGVELATLAAAAVLVAASRPGWQTAAFAWWAGCAVALAFIDARHHRLPDRLTYPAAAGTAALLGIAALTEHAGTAWVRSMLAAVCTATLFGALSFVLGDHGPGLGDAKLMLSVGMLLGWIGWTALLSGVLAGMAAQGLWALTLLATRRVRRSTMLPLGPCLIVGAMLILATSHTQ